MPLFMRVKTEKGYDMVPVSPEDIKPVKVSEPMSPTLNTSSEAGPIRRRFICSLCTPPRAFAGAGVASMHFNKTHKELAVEKDSWRGYVKLEETDDTGS